MGKRRLYGSNFHTNLPPSQQLSADRERVRIKPWSQLTDQTATVKHRSLPWEVVPNSCKAAEDGEPSESFEEEEDLEHEAQAVEVKEEAVIKDASQDVTEDKEEGGEQYFLDEFDSDSDAKDLKSDIEYAEVREGIGTSKEL